MGRVTFVEDFPEGPFMRCARCGSSWPSRPYNEAVDNLITHVIQGHRVENGVLRKNVDYTWSQTA